MRRRFLHFMYALLGIATVLVVGITLEKYAGVPFWTTYRIVCAGACLLFLATLARDYHERWAWFAVALATAVNATIFLTPLMDGPASRGEIMIFALPDAFIFFVARAATFPARDVHERAVRQQLILGAVLAGAFCMLFMGLFWIAPRAAHVGIPSRVSAP